HAERTRLLVHDRGLRTRSLRSVPTAKHLRQRSTFSDSKSPRILRPGADLVTQLGEDRGKPGGQVLVELDVHGLLGIPGTGMSSCADAAANAMAARTSSSVRVGKSSSTSSVVAPSARLASTLRSVTRVPFRTGSPPQTFGWRTMRRR